MFLEEIIPHINIKHKLLFTDFLENDAKHLVSTGKLIGSFNLPSFVEGIKPPRRILLMISGNCYILTVSSTMTVS